jgi:hypothetical protein
MAVLQRSGENGKLQRSGENGKSAMGGRGCLNHDPLQAGLQTDRAHHQRRRQIR